MDKTIKVCKKTESCYPVKIRSTSYAPQQLYYMGDISLCNDIVIGVIGKRDTTVRCLNMSAQIGERLAELGITIVNGLAIGCDSSVIKGSLSKNGKVIAVMPCGLDIVYPKQNANLFDKILEMGGCLISEYPAGTKPTKYHFVQRDRLQAAIANKVLVVDAESMGGTMHTVRYADKLGKKIGCVDDAKSTMSSGNVQLLSTGKAVSVKDTAGLHSFITDNTTLDCVQLELSDFSQYASSR